MSIHSLAAKRKDVAKNLLNNWEEIIFTMANILLIYASSLDMFMSLDTRHKGRTYWIKFSFSTEE